MCHADFLFACNGLVSPAFNLYYCLSAFDANKDLYYIYIIALYANEISSTNAALIGQAEMSQPISERSELMVESTV